jgi:hypothetical protein
LCLGIFHIIRHALARGPFAVDAHSVDGQLTTKYHASHIVTRNTSDLSFPLIYENRLFRVYEITAK